MAITPLRWFCRISYPLVWLLNMTANLILRGCGLNRAPEHDSAHSEEELRLILAQSHRLGAIKTEERDLLERVFDFGDRRVHQIMVPRSDIIYLSTRRSLAENVELARQQEHSRFPLCDGDLDRVLGMVHLKDLLWRLREQGDHLDLLSLKRDIIFVPETQPIGALMKDIQKRHTHMAVVVDEYGGTAGLVTLEDVIEEIVGEIQDEFDEEAPKFLHHEDGSVLMDGRVLIDEAEKSLQVELSDEHNTTIGGHLLSLIGRRPRLNDHMDVPGYTARIVDIKGLRIAKILFQPRPDPSAQPPKP
jgi:CBS domain containing-hemolysin-like protein